MAVLYDLTLMLDPNAPAERQDEIVGEVKRMIEAKGTLVGAHDWGVRRLAYQIDHRPEAAYHLLQFEGPPELLEQLSHSLRIAEGVLRARTIRVKAGTEAPASPQPDGGRRAEGGATAVAARAAADAPPQGDGEGPSEGDAPVGEPAEDPAPATGG